MGIRALTTKGIIYEQIKSKELPPCTSPYCYLYIPQGGLKPRPHYKRVTQRLRGRTPLFWIQIEAPVQQVDKQLEVFDFRGIVRASASCSAHYASFEFPSGLVDGE